MDRCCGSHRASPAGLLRNAVPSARLGSPAWRSYAARPSAIAHGRGSSASEDRPGSSPDTGCRRTHSRSARTPRYARLLSGRRRSWPAGCAQPLCSHGRADQARKARGHPRRPAAATGHGDQTVPAMRRRQADGFRTASGFCGTSGTPRPVTSGHRRGLEQHHHNVSNRRYPLRPGLLPLLRDKPGERLSVKQ